MGISRYLAMTAAEMATFSVMEGWSASYMACHFSPYATGISNVPSSLPSGSMLILNDRTPFHGHDPQQILGQLQEISTHVRFDCLLLDFERPDVDACAELCHVLTKQLSCPVGVSAPYAGGLDCPVFLPPAPLDQPLADYISLWEGREVWLDIATEAACITVTQTGSAIAPVSFSAPPENAFVEDTLCCRYRAEITEDAVRFHLWRDLTEAEHLIEHAQSLGITKCIGLFQQLCSA